MQTLFGQFPLRLCFFPEFFSLFEEAFNYWTDLNDTSDSIAGNPDKLIPGEKNVPIYNWECKYCEFQGKYCPGLYNI